MQAALTNIKPDLHVHTDASDGQYSPLQVISMAVEKGLNLLAITDHDTIDGLERAQDAALQAGIGLIPGVEISAGGGNEVHILGFGIHSGMKRLFSLLQEMRNEREVRIAKMLEKLKNIGLNLSVDEIAPPQAQSLGRAHIGRVMVEKGMAASLFDAFDKYLSPGRPGYEPRPRRMVSDVVRLMREEGAVPVIAHPGLLKMETQDVRALLVQWKDDGLMGLEAYHPSHLPHMTKVWDDMARSLQLLVTGGSDYHGQDGRHMDLGAMLPYWQTAHEDISTLLEVIGPHDR